VVTLGALVMVVAVAMVLSVQWVSAVRQAQQEVVLAETVARAAQVWLVVLAVMADPSWVTVVLAAPVVQAE